jgi:type IV pilus assembly protein PilW
VAAHNIALAAPDFTFPLTPVQIIPNALTPGAPVQIAVMYGNSAYFVLGRNFTVGSSATSKKLAARDGFHVGDIVLVTSADIGTLPCAAALVEVTGFPTPDDGHSIVHAQGASYVSFYTGGNPRATMNATSGAATTVAPSGLTYNLGPNPSRNLWQVVGPDPLHPQSNPNFLVFNDTLHSDAQAQAAAGIVNLQAEYGVDNGGSSPGATAGDGIISPSEWTSVQPTDPTRLLAVRFAVLARSQQYEATAVTTVAPFWANDPVGHSFTMFNVDGTADTSPGNANDWRRYRYRVYESIVPLRNMLWWQQ